jgi:hypothetical protein
MSTALTIPINPVDEDGVQQLSGGILRVQMGTVSPDLVPGIDHQTRVNPGTMQFGADGKFVSRPDVTKANVSDLVNRSSASVLETAHRPSGAPIRGELQLTDRVHLNTPEGSIEVDVATAQALGYLTRRNGEWVETTNGSASPKA